MSLSCLQEIVLITDSGSVVHRLQTTNICHPPNHAPNIIFRQDSGGGVAGGSAGGKAGGTEGGATVTGGGAGSVASSAVAGQAVPPLPADFLKDVKSPLESKLIVSRVIHIFYKQALPVSNHTCSMLVSRSRVES